MAADSDNHSLIGRIGAINGTRANNGRGVMLSALTDKIANPCIKYVAEKYKSSKACYNSNYK